MELELGLKITKVRDDFTSAEFLLAKDRAGPIFLSRETDTMFILTAHLKGYKRKYIKMEINEDGTRIEISGEKPVQEMVMENWRVYKKEVEIRGFRKAFKIPDGVVLDKIKARFNEKDSSLTIKMPKLVKGVRGLRVEEVKQEEEVVAAESSEREYEYPDSQDIKGIDPSVEKSADESEFVQEKEIEELGAEEAEKGDSIEVYPAQISGQGNQSKGIDPSVEKSADDESEIVKEKEIEELGAEKAETGDLIEVYPAEISGQRNGLKGIDPSVEKSSDESEIVQEIEELGAEEAETGDSMEVCPAEISGQEVEDLKEESTNKELEEGERTETIEEPRKTIEEQVIQEKEIPSPQPLVEEAQVNEEKENPSPPGESKMEEKESEKLETPQDIVEPKEDKHVQELDQIEKQSIDKDDEVQEKEDIQRRENGIVEEEEEEEEAHRSEPSGTEQEKSLRDQTNQASKPHGRRRIKICAPIMVGSAFLVSIIVFVIHLIRTKNPPSSKKKN